MRVLLSPFALGSKFKVDVTEDAPGTRWSSGWSLVTEEQYFGGTLISAKDVGMTLMYKFTGTAISVYGTEGTNSRSKRANSSYVIDGSTPHVHQESMTTATSNVLFYNSKTLEDGQHTLVIKNLVDGGELQLDYFEVIGSTVRGGKRALASPAPSGGDKPLQPAVIAGLAIASAVVLAGFILLFILWRRQYVRQRTKKLETHPKLQLQSQEDAQRVPFLNERARIEHLPPASSQPSRAPAPAVMTVTPLLPPPPTDQAVATLTPHREEKRLLPTGPGHTMESISRLNLGLDVDPRNHSVVGQSSDYESEASAAPRPNRRGRGGDSDVSLLGSPETINPKALRLPPDYRRFYS